MLQRKLVIIFQASSHFYHQSIPTCIHLSYEELQRHWLQIRCSPFRSRPSIEDQGNEMYILQVAEDTPWSWDSKDRIYFYALSFMLTLWHVVSLMAYAKGSERIRLSWNGGQSFHNSLQSNLVLTDKCCSWLGPHREYLRSGPMNHSLQLLLLEGLLHGMWLHWEQEP